MSLRFFSLRCASAAALAGLAVLAMSGASPAGASCAHPRDASPDYRQRAMHAAAGLGAPPDYARTHRWPLQPQAAALASAGTDVYGRRLRLAPRAADALHAMVVAAARDGVTLQAVSGFRSFDYQHRLLRRKLDRGVPLAAVLEVNALPGFSEHHSGCALDLTTPGAPAADTAFGTTPAFAWLTAHAGRFGFVLSYPPGNAQGVDFEPWHWRYAGSAEAARRASVAEWSRHAAPPSTRAAAAPDASATIAGLPVQGLPR